MNKKMSKAVEDLAYIKNILSDIEKNAFEKSVKYLLWGIVFAVGQWTTFLLIMLKVHGIIDHSYRYDIILWSALFLLRWFFSFILDDSPKRIKPNFSASLIKTVWMSAFISSAIFIFVSLCTRSVSPMYINPVACLFLGMIYHIFSKIYRSKWMLLFSFCWWAGAVLMFTVPGYYEFLLFGMMTVVFYIAPVFLFHRKYKKAMR